MKALRHHAEQPGTLSEYLACHPWLDPKKRDKVIGFIVHRKKASSPNKAPKRGDKNIEITIKNEDYKIKMETLSCLTSVAYQFLRMAVAAFKPEQIQFNHGNGELNELQNLWKENDTKSLYR